MEKEKIECLTEEYGGQYGINHMKRILHIINIIGEGFEYDYDVVWMAACLHDWGGYTKWQISGVDHALRSKQVAEDFLKNAGYDEIFINHVLECIALHHSGRQDKSLEAKLISDADAIDFLGVIGVLRDFSTKPRELRKAYETSKGRKEKLVSVICLDRSRGIIEERMKRMERLFAEFEEETFGYY